MYILSSEKYDSTNHSSTACVVKMQGHSAFYKMLIIMDKFCNSYKISYNLSLCNHFLPVLDYFTLKIEQIKKMRFKVTNLKSALFVISV